MRFLIAALSAATFLITANTACGNGAGISVSFASPTIRDNTITDNSKQPGCSGDSGGGISVGGAASAQIIHNTITNNTTDFGGGIDIVNQSDAPIVQNLITGNTSPRSGGGLYVLTPSGTRGPALVNNTLSGNSAPDSGVVLGGFDGQVQLFNNIIAAATSQPAVLFDHNDLFNSTGPATQGSCSQVVGPGGNLSAAPQFASAGDYHLQASSPAIDTGNNNAPSLPSTALGGGPRISGGAVDQGVYEFQQPLVLTMSSIPGSVEGAGFSAVLAHFSGGAGPYSAGVSWGDGQTSPGFIGAGNSVSDSTGATAGGTTPTSAADAGITLSGTRLTVQHRSNFTATVATLSDGDPNGNAVDYTGRISWGDGATSTCPSTACTLAQVSGGFSVSGSHNYRRSRTYTVTIQLNDTGGSAASTTTTITAN